MYVLTNTHTQTHADALELVSDEESTLSDDHYRAIKSLWADSGVKACYGRRREFQISDSAKQ